jgi:hypothetical protein
MILKCTDNKSDSLGEFQRGRAVGLGVTYDLTVGKDYRVAGMMLWETTLAVIVNGDDGWPTSVPAGFFEQVPLELPSDWFFALGRGVKMSGSDLWVNPMVAIWGYRELVEDDGHLDALLEGESAACAVFFRWLNDDAVPEP